MKPAPLRSLAASFRRRPLESAALAAVFLAAAALALTRIGPDGTPWHLATARYALSHGGPISGWPTTNVFSYTFPDHPLYQQYPFYQAVLMAVFRLGGYEALTVLHAAAWVVVLGLWVAWGARGDRARLHLLWLLLLLGFSQRMILRPDVLTLALLAGQLLLIDAYRDADGGRRWPLAGLIGLQWLLANTHQLFTLGLAIQLLFLFHLLIVRRFKGRQGISTSDRELPWRPVATAVAASHLACLVTPLGPAIVRTPWTTFRSLAAYRAHVVEFAPLAEHPFQAALVGLAVALAILGLVRERGSWQPLHAGLCVLGIALAAGAVRGTAFAVALCAGVFGRSFPAPAPWRSGGTSPGPADGGRRIRSLLPIALTLSASLLLVQARWCGPPNIDGVQPGVGKALGQWPTASIEFLERNLPPGRVLNLSWYSGNVLVWHLYPERRVFADGRFEAYPIEFLSRVIAAEESPRILAELIAEHDPSWLVGELALESVQDRGVEMIESGEWAIVFLDPVWFILVRREPSTASYLRRHAAHPAGIRPRGLIEGEPLLLKAQRERLYGFFRRLGLDSLEAERATRGR